MAKGDDTEDKGAVEALPAGQIRCYITGTLRRDTPEEHVRQRIARSLVEDYGYSKGDIQPEFTIKMGSLTGKKKPRIDLAIFKPGEVHDQEHVFIAIECKAARVKEFDRSEGVEQLKSYMAASASCRYGMWVGASFRVFEKTGALKTGWEFGEATDLPRSGSDSPRALRFDDLILASGDELIGVFRRCHNYIYGNQGDQKEKAFHELLKLIFCKVYDEDTSRGPLKFYISNEEYRSEIGRRRFRSVIDELFGMVKSRYRYIFREEDKIDLETHVLARIATELQKYALLETPADVKGIAYEQLVGANLRGDRGEFFTPRNVCEMAVRMVFSTYPRNEWLRLKVLDPACGTGGFLVSVLDLWRETIRQDEASKRSRAVSKVEEDTARRLQEVAEQCLSGIDFNSTLTRSAQMNMVMHGDGSTNIFKANSLEVPGEWPREPPNDVYHNVKLGEFDVVVTNPPFGKNVRIDDVRILEQFELATEGVRNDRLRSSMPPEQLFLERCLAFLRPGGRLAIVLPDSILSNPGLEFIRKWLLRQTRVIASISLPQLTFEPYTGTKTSVLVLQKKHPAQVKAESEAGTLSDYEIFMATPKAVGHDRRGNPYLLRTPDGDAIEYEREMTMTRRDADGKFERVKRIQKAMLVHDELPEVSRYFREWLEYPGRREELGG